jgi:nitroreductase
MNTSKPITEIINQRFSCRTYSKTPIDIPILEQLEEFCTKTTTGPFGTKSRFDIVASRDGDSEILKGLGTYGFIQDPAGFIIGLSKETDKHLVDFGYLMEMIILYATDLGLGTCWLGGTFTRSRFAERVTPLEGEIIPAVTSIGYIGAKPRKLDARIRQAANSDKRFPWNKLFFNSEVDIPLAEREAGKYKIPLEMVRLGPSASNKQPWRIIKDNKSWHFFLKRTPGYSDNPSAVKLSISDLQLTDMGIAMCHFELTSNELGLDGYWEISDKLKTASQPEMEYIVTWCH